MKSLVSIAIAAAALFGASAASATVVANFQLNGSLANAAGGGVTLTSNGGAVLGATGITFAANDGPTLTGLGTIGSYTLEIGGTFDETSGFRKIADFFDRASDTGWYDLSGSLNFYPEVTGPVVMSNGTPFVAKLTRDSSALVTGYVNGVEQFSFTDSGNLAVIDSVLHLFRDDFATSEGEASSGFIDYVTLDSGEPGVGGVPEPGTWALMILGFGGAGAMVRRRRAAFA